MTIISYLKQLGFTDKESQVYLTLLNIGPASVREVAQAAKVNRGTSYDILKSLIKKGLVSYYHQDKHQYFLAEDPGRLKNFLDEKMSGLQAAQTELGRILPELRSVYNRAEEKPVVRYYEDARGVKIILEDVLSVMSEAKEKLYYVYSAADVRQHLYEGFPNFAKERIRRKIRCQVIAAGSGGQLWGLDERRWLGQQETAPTYMIIYSNKLALISLNREKKPIGMIITDPGLFQTNKIIFEFMWRVLDKKQKQ